MKELINQIANPVYSFTIVIGLFYLMIKYVEVFARKSTGYILAVGFVVSVAILLLDPVFRTNFGMTNDNVPIIFLMALVIGTTWFALHLGIENDKRIERGESPIEGTPENREKVWSWPNLVYTELFAMILCTVFLVVWAIFFKSPLEEPANPTWAPNPAKAPWYFLGLQEILVYFDPWIAGVVLPVLILAGLIAIPYIDKNPKGNGYFTFKERKFAIISFLFGWLVLWIFLIIVGTAMRGPNWTFYGPFEVWDLHKVEAANNVNLAEYFWIKLLNMSLPTSIFVREIMGIFAIVAYFAGGAWAFTKWKGKEYLQSMGRARYTILVMLLLIMMSLPIKMYLRWFINLKYIVAMPEFELNI